MKLGRLSSRIITDGQFGEPIAQLFLTRKYDFFNTFFSFWYDKIRILCYLFRKNDFVGGIGVIMSFISKIFRGFFS